MGSLNILALCDGHSGGQIALTELGVSINQYYASEIDKFAIQQTQHNFPKTIQLGDIENWREWDIDFKSIDLILAGTPCQGFSFAGKQLAFDDPRSRLFFVFVDILNHIRKLNPDVKFLLENVNMKKSHLEVISRYTGVFPVRINSNLVSAQNRDRWYWTNVKTKQVGLFGEIYSDIPQPKDRGILLRDILEKDVAEKYYIKNPKIGFEGMNINGKSNTLRTGGGLSQSDKHNCDIIKIDKQGNPKKNQDKASCFTAGAHSGGNHSDMDLILQLGRGYNKGGLHQDKTPTLTKNSWEQNNLLCIGNIYNNGQNSQGGRVYDINYKSATLNGEAGGGGAKTGLYLIPEATKKGYVEIKPGECFDSENIKSNTRRGRLMTYKSNCLMSNGNHFMRYTHDYRIRRLTPTECARLQTIPDWYEWICSDTQIYKQCGNGWTIEVIKHILYQWDLVNESVLTKAI